MAYAVRISFALALAATAPAPAAAQPDCGYYQYKARITSVYDGDTVRADIDLGFDIWRHDEPLRLYGIDTPEVRGDERPAGLDARDALRERIEGKDVTICTIRDGTGKYGRYLAIIWDGEENVNEWLVASGYAVPYN